ncbi:MAG: hypothetical protein N2V78_12740 [Methanophagales archaeon]|nr:hypothetical protein [Methanophagales archaeon]
MKKEVPQEFLNLYKTKYSYLQETLKKIKSELQLRLSQLGARKGIRARITDARVKRPYKIWKNAQKAGIPVSEVFMRTEDLLGVRIVCNNLSDIDPLIKMIQQDVSTLDVLEVKDLISSPSPTGYRAKHVRTLFRDIFQTEEEPLPCEIQIRTLAQDTWARLSREDLYGKNAPQNIRKLARTLSIQLSAIDDIAQLIRDELNKCPPQADKIQDSDAISPQRLALLYKHKFGKDIFEWTLVDWIQTLYEAEAETIGDVRKLLNDEKLRNILDKLAVKIRKFPLEDSEWAVFSAVVATEASISIGIKTVRSRIQQEWDEIVATARREALSGMPETLDEFIQMLQSGVIPTEALAELGGIQSCYRCGSDILRPEQAAEAVLDYYGWPDTDTDLEQLFINADSEGIVESADYSGVCQYCGYQMSKDD